MASKNLPARRRSSAGSAAKRAAEYSVSLAKRRVSRARERQADIKAKAIGGGVSYLAAGYWGKRRANEQRGEGKAGFEVGGYEIGGDKIGAGMALAGVLGLIGDNMYDEVLFVTGISIIAADRAIDGYTARLDEPPEA